MAKDKRQIPKTTKKDFFYEISGTLTILLCLVLLSELGTVGIILKNLFKLLFGDYYFIIVFYLIGQGIYALVKEKWFNFKSLRFNGFLLFLVSLFLIVHIAYLDLYNISNQTILSSSLEMYKTSIFEGKTISSYGGGVIGAIIAQIFVVLFNRIGALIFAIIFLILSISFMTNLRISNVYNFSRFMFSKTKKMGMIVYRYFKNIDYPQKQTKIKNRGFIINLNLLTDIDTNSNRVLQNRISNEEFEAIIALIYRFNGYVSDKKVMIGYTQTRYYITGNMINVSESSLDSILKRKYLLYKESNRLIIEAPNKVKEILTIKSLLVKSLTIDIPLGIELNDSIISFNPLVNQNILISGEEGSGIRTFIKSFVISLIFKLKDNFDIILCDFLDHFADFKFFDNMFFPINKKVEALDDLLDELTIELEKRLTIINEFGADNYLSLNKILINKKIDEIKPIFLIINDLDTLRKKNYNVINKLIYFLKFGYKSGIHIIMINRSSGISSQILSNTKTKLVLKTTVVEQSFEILNSKNACSLIGNGDALMVLDISVFHLQLPFISDADFRRVMNKYILN